MIARRHLLAAGMTLAASAPRTGRAASFRRVVSVGGALTETVYALGAGDALVAVDSTSLYPPAATGLPQIGYMRAVPPEGIVSLMPDLVLLSSDAGPPQAVDVLRAAGLRLAVIPDGAAGVEAVSRKIAAIGEALELGAAAAALSDAVAADWRLLDAPVAALPSRPGVLFVLSLDRGVPLVSGRGSHADALIAAAGGRNLLQDFAGYRPLSPEAAAGLQPDAVVMMEHSLRSAGGPEAVAALPGLALTPAGAARRILSIGSTDLAFGPRAAQARRKLAVQLHPERDWPELPARAWARE